MTHIFKNNSAKNRFYKPALCNYFKNCVFLSSIKICRIELSAKQYLLYGNIGNIHYLKKLIYTRKNR